MKRLFYTTLLALNVLAALAVPAKRDPIEIVQPNGDTLTILLRGDERRHWRTTTDGYVICENSKGYYCYAKQNRKGNIVPSNHIAQNADKRTKCDWRYLHKMEKNENLYKKINQ